MDVAKLSELITELNTALGYPPAHFGNAATSAAPYNCSLTFRDDFPKTMLWSLVYNAETPSRQVVPYLMTTDVACVVMETLLLAVQGKEFVPEPKPTKPEPISAWAGSTKPTLYQIEMATLKILTASKGEWMSHPKEFFINRIPAIKNIREMTGVMLKPAKLYVDSVIDAYQMTMTAEGAIIYQGIPNYHPLLDSYDAGWEVDTN